MSSPPEGFYGGYYKPSQKPMTGLSITPRAGVMFYTFNDPDVKLLSKYLWLYTYYVCGFMFQIW